MTTQDFNEKWKDYLEEGFYGLAIPHPKVVEYLEEVFSNELTKDPNFKFKQIKVKFHWTCFYSNAPMEVNQRIEDTINEILKENEA